MNEIAKLASESAANQNPNYLPVLLLICAIIGGAWLFRWLVGRLEKQTTLLEGLFAEANAGRAEVAGIVSENTATIRDFKTQLHENTEFLRQNKEHLARIHH